MARSRIIKPSFCTNDVLAKVHPLGRLLFASLWMIADREGRIEDRPSRIKVQTLPYDDCDVDSLLGDLACRGFIRRYEAKGLRLIQIVNWHKHQTPHVKEPPSTLPAPDEYGASTILEPDRPGSSTSGDSPQDGPAPYRHRTGLVPAPDLSDADPMLTPVGIGARTVPASEPAGKSASSGTGSFLFPFPNSISDSVYPNPVSFSPPPEPSPPPNQADVVHGESDSDRHKRNQEGDSVIPSLRTIADRARLRFSPSEVAGFIMAHFPMRKVDYRQRPVPGDNGLTVDQVNCIVRHGCTLENARKAYEHFKQEPNPNKGGAWAFHCLQDELSQDARIDLREETRTAQRDFKERAGSQLSEESKPDSTHESPEVRAPSP